PAFHEPLQMPMNRAPRRDFQFSPLLITVKFLLPIKKSLPRSLICMGRPVNKGFGNAPTAGRIRRLLPERVQLSSSVGQGRRNRQALRTILRADCPAGKACRLLPTVSDYSYV